MDLINLVSERILYKEPQQIILVQVLTIGSKIIF